MPQPKPQQISTVTAVITSGTSSLAPDTQQSQFSSNQPRSRLPILCDWLGSLCLQEMTKGKFILYFGLI